jgi:hypothetical protein
VENLTKLRELEAERSKLLLEKELDWCIKSKAIWLDVGDQNTNFFHNFTNHKKTRNTIWKLSNQDGTKVRGFRDLADLGVDCFSGLFVEPRENNIGEIVKVISYFSHMVTIIHQSYTKMDF